MGGEIDPAWKICGEGSHAIRNDCRKDGARSNADEDVRVTAGREAGATNTTRKDGARRGMGQ